MILENFDTMLEIPQILCVCIDLQWYDSVALYTTIAQSTTEFC